MFQYLDEPIEALHVIGHYVEKVSISCIVKDDSNGKVIGFIGDGSLPYSIASLKISSADILASIEKLDKQVEEMILVKKQMLANLQYLSENLENKDE